MRQARTLLSAKDWLKCRPSPVLMTHIPNTAFRWWLSYYCRNTLALGNTCYRCNCTKSLDIHGDHLLHFPNSSYTGITTRNRRHDQLVLFLARTLRSAYQSPIIELRNREKQAQPPTPSPPTITSARDSAHQSQPLLKPPPQSPLPWSRPDMRALGPSGGEYLIDVTLPLMLGEYAMHTAPGTTLRHSAARKGAKHENYTKSIHGGRLVPIVISTTGGWLEESHRYVIDAVPAINSAERGKIRATRSLIFLQFAALLVATNAGAGSPTPSPRNRSPKRFPSVHRLPHYVRYAPHRSTGPSTSQSTAPATARHVTCPSATPHRRGHDRRCHVVTKGRMYRAPAYKCHDILYRLSKRVPSLRFYVFVSLFFGPRDRINKSYGVFCLAYLSWRELVVTRRSIRLLFQK